MICFPLLALNRDLGSVLVLMSALPFGRSWMQWRDARSNGSKTVKSGLFDGLTSLS